MVKIIICPRDYKKLDKRSGIHLNNPNGAELNAAIERAENEGFESVFMHTHSVAGRYLIDSSMWRFLFAIHSDRIGIDIEEFYK